MIELNEKRAAKEGRVTRKALITHLLEQVENGEIESIVYVVKKKDNIITAGWSDISHVESLGMLEAGKADVLNYMRD